MNKHNTARSFAIILLGTSLLAACAKQVQTPPPADTVKVNTAPVKQGEGRGVIKGVDSSMKTVTLSHNNIPGIMEAMAMEYNLERLDLLSGVKIGDSVVFTLQDRGEGNFVVTKMTTITKR